MFSQLEHKLCDLREDDKAVKDVNGQASDEEVGSSVHRMVDRIGGQCESSRGHA